jgi:hypothetical protein
MREQRLVYLLTTSAARRGLGFHEGCILFWQTPVHVVLVAVTERCPIPLCLAESLPFLSFAHEDI